MQRLYASIIAPEGVAIATDVPLDSGTVGNVFSITGGPILLLALIAEVTETVSAHNCTARLIMVPTVGANTNMCAVVDIINTTVGSFLTIDGTIANAMIKAVPSVALPLGIGLDIPLILPVGLVGLSLSNSTPTSGIATFYLRYKPLAEGARVEGN